MRTIIKGRAIVKMSKAEFVRWITLSSFIAAIKNMANPQIKKGKGLLERIFLAFIVASFLFKKGMRGYCYKKYCNNSHTGYKNNSSSFFN